MNIGDYMILAVILFWGFGALFYMKMRRKHGKCIGCGGDCLNCHKK